MLDGTREHVRSADGIGIGIVTAGSGPRLLLVHGGMTTAERWQPLWERLTGHFRVTALDRRGRSTSGDGTSYAVEAEYRDVSAVARHLETRAGPIDVLGHSYGASCAMGAAAMGAPIGRLVLYEPPDHRTVPSEWVERVKTLISEGQPGRAVASFLIEIIGLNPDAVMAMRDAPVAANSIAVAEQTMAREAEALSMLHLDGLAPAVTQPVLLLLGNASPPWASVITASIADALPRAEVVTLHGLGHEGVDTDPEAVAAALRAFFLFEHPTAPSSVGRRAPP